MLLTNVTNNQLSINLFYTVKTTRQDNHDTFTYTFQHKCNNSEVNICQNTHTLLFVRKLVLQHCIIHWICFWQMPWTISYQSNDICSLKRASDGAYPLCLMLAPASTQFWTHSMLRITTLQHTIVVSFIIGLSCLVSGPSYLIRQLGPEPSGSSCKGFLDLSLYDDDLNLSINIYAYSVDSSTTKYLQAYIFLLMYYSFIMYIYIYIYYIYIICDE